MPEYVMPINSAEARKRFKALDVFTRGYVEAALWCGSDENQAAFDDIAPEMLADMVLDCSDFQERSWTLLDQWNNDHESGADFWLVRNGHSPRFWGRGRGGLGDALTDAAHVYPEMRLYTGDDGLIYAR